MNIVLRSWFYLKMDYEPNEIKNPDPNNLVIESNKFEEAAPDLNKIKPWEILAGHYHHPRFSLSKRFPGIYEAQNVKLITFIRDPLSHHLSMYKFGKKMGHDFAKNLSLSDYMNKDINFFARALECTIENYKSRIDSYFFVGIVEEYNKSMQLLSKKISKPDIKKIPFENRSYSNSLLESLSKEEINSFKENNKLDYLIYDYCLKTANLY